MNNPDRVRLEHMLDSARDGLSFAAGHLRAELETGRLRLRLDNTVLDLPPLIAELLGLLEQSAECFRLQTRRVS